MRSPGRSTGKFASDWSFLFFVIIGVLHAEEGAESEVCSASMGICARMGDGGGLIPVFEFESPDGAAFEGLAGLSRVT